VIGRPVVFVHGNGDSAALWHTTLWRFESNGVPRDRLFAIDFSLPEAREDDTLPMPCRSGTDDQLRELGAFVARVLAQTGAGRIALVASSRGANAVRHFVRNGGGEELVVDAVLCGGVNHGVHVSPTFNPRSEFNGASPFMRALNAPSHRACAG
jgi:triacylglycerol esterase/lipase EstA (alpha/beta hydrolase family)